MTPKLCNWQAALPGLLLALVCGAASAAPSGSAAPIPFKQERAAASVDGPRLAAGLCIALLAAGAGLYVLRQRLRAGPEAARLLQVLESRRLTPRASLHVIAFGGAQYLLAHSEQGVVCLASTPAAQQGEPA